MRRAFFCRYKSSCGPKHGLFCGNEKYTTLFPCHLTRFPLEGQMLRTNFAIVFCVGFGCVVDASVWEAMKPDTRRHCHVTNCPKHFCSVALQTRATHLRTFRRKGNVAAFPGLQRPDISLHPLTLELGQTNTCNHRTVPLPTLSVHYADHCQTYVFWNHPLLRMRFKDA